MPLVAVSDVIHVYRPTGKHFKKQKQLIPRDELPASAICRAGISLSELSDLRKCSLTIQALASLNAKGLENAKRKSH